MRAVLFLILTLVVGAEAAKAGAGPTYRRLDVGEGLELHLVLANPKTHSLKVVDNPGQGLAAAMDTRGCVAGVNGGYFHADNTPLGLVVADGQRIHPLERAKLLSGLMVVNASGKVSLLRTGEFKSTPRQALQAGPFLVDRSKPVAGLNATKRATRTVVFTDDKGRFGLLVCDPVTLAEMARILTSPEVAAETRIVRALNLDGGTSSALWVEGKLVVRNLKPVRNYLALHLR